MSHEILLGNDKFAGYRWTYFSSLREGPLRSRAESILGSTNWDTLVQLATTKRNGLTCRLLPEIGLGYNYTIRILELSDQVRWVARLRMPHLSQGGDEPDKESNIPVPHVHMIQSDPNSPVGAPFMLMDCLRGTVGMDLSMAVPSAHKLRAFASMAEIQIEMFNIRLPKIGKIIGINDDGSYRQGPIPGLGGPFETAAEFFMAWSAKVQFGLSHDQLKDAAGSFADELSISSLAFKALMNDMAEELSKSNEGPFPLCHGDFGHNNMIFDDNYRLLGVIDWEGALAAPCEISGEFPLTLSVVPPAMDVPWNYDENDHPKDAETRQRFADRELYIAIVRQLEKERGLTERYNLSSVLQDSQQQHLASTMRLYQSGKPGWYAKVLQEISNGG